MRWCFIYHRYDGLGGVSYNIGMMDGGALYIMGMTNGVVLHII